MRNNEKIEKKNEEIEQAKKSLAKGDNKAKGPDSYRKRSGNNGKGSEANDEVLLSEFISKQSNDQKAEEEEKSIKVGNDTLQGLSGIKKHEESIETDKDHLKDHKHDKNNIPPIPKDPMLLKKPEEKANSGIDNQPRRRSTLEENLKISMKIQKSSEECSR
jgi:hypothetical protein